MYLCIPTSSVKPGQKLPASRLLPELILRNFCKVEETYRSKEDWFIGTINNGERRQLQVPLVFVTPSSRYTAHIYSESDAVMTRTRAGLKLGRWTSTSYSIGRCAPAEAKQPDLRLTRTNGSPSSFRRTTTICKETGAYVLRRGPRSFVQFIQP